MQLPCGERQPASQANAKPEMLYLEATPVGSAGHGYRRHCSPVPHLRLCQVTHQSLRRVIRAESKAHYGAKAVCRGHTHEVQPRHRRFEKAIKNRRVLYRPDIRAEVRMEKCQAAQIDPVTGGGDHMIGHMNATSP